MFETPSAAPFLWHPPRLLYEDADLLVVDKPAGLSCQAVEAGGSYDVPGWLKRWLADRRGVDVNEVYLGTHQRLDRETSGVLLYTLLERANAGLAQQFEARTVEKTYLAAVSGKPPAPGTLLVHALVSAGAGLMRVARPGERGAKQARTRVLAVHRRAGRSLLTLAIETGRTHQVRVQLAAAGCPIVGDGLYGGEPAGRLFLHAERLRLRHPVTDTQLEMASPLPFEFESWLEHGLLPASAEPRLLAAAIERACMRRYALACEHATGATTTFRLFNDAADGVPGCAVDVYAGWLVLRIDGDDRGTEEQALIDGLAALGPTGIYLKRHPKQANQLADPTLPQIAPHTPVWGEPAPDPLIVYEGGVPFEVKLHEGLRTGLFLDMRDNRARLRELARGRRVLNLFGYTGSLSVAALLGAATQVTTVDTSRAALEWAERNVARNGGSERHRSVAQDAFLALEALARAGERFELVIVDPPSYSTSKRGRFRVVKDYAALCEAALSVLADEGLLLACLNHSAVTRGALRAFVRAAAGEVGREVRTLTDLPHGRDFPVVSGEEPALKSVLAELGPRRGLRSRSARLTPKKTRH